jgi:hypothetical protein
MNGMLSTHMKSNMGTGDSGRAKLLPASLSVGRKRDPASPFHWGNGGINMNQHESHESTWINMNKLWDFGASYFHTNPDEESL